MLAPAAFHSGHTLTPLVSPRSSKQSLPAAVRGKKKAAASPAPKPVKKRSSRFSIVDIDSVLASDNVGQRGTGEVDTSRVAPVARKGAAVKVQSRPASADAVQAERPRTNGLQTDKRATSAIPRANGVRAEKAAESSTPEQTSTNAKRPTTQPSARRNGLKAEKPAKQASAARSSAKAAKPAEHTPPGSSTAGAAVERTQKPPPLLLKQPAPQTATKFEAARPQQPSPTPRLRPGATVVGRPFQACKVCFFLSFYGTNASPLFVLSPMFTSS